ncbi:MAG TPA: FtsW/RodA/SpoVE family cell cycle protein, partial [Pedococcus sp.]
MSSASAAAGKARQPDHGRVPAWLQRLESPVTTYYVLLSATAVLVVIGLIMVLSASAIVSYKSSDSSYTIFLRQAQFAAFGAVVMAVAARTPVRRWKALAVPALLGAM